jgi:ascorbate PTS system EIIB component
MLRLSEKFEKSSARKVLDRSMKIYAVCGAGIGTSVLLKSNIDRVLVDLGIEAEVQAVSVSQAMESDSPAQLVLITPELSEKITGIASEVVTIQNIFDLAELSQKLEHSLG